MNAMTIIQPQSKTISPLPALGEGLGVRAITPSAQNKKQYPRILFNFEDAYTRVTTKSKSEATRAAYRRDLNHFLNYLSDRLPTPQIIFSYIQHFRALGTKDSSINRYLSTARQFCRALAEQTFPAANIKSAAMDAGLDGFSAMIDLENARTNLTAAASYKLVSQDEKSYDAPLMQHGIRLSLIQLKELSASIDRSTLRGKQDFAIIAVLALTLIRRAECARMQMQNFIEKDGETYKLQVRGKRNNITPVSANQQVVDALKEWIDAYNAAVGDDDPRQITRDSSIWRPLHPTGGQPIDYELKDDAFGYKIAIRPKAIGETVGRVAAAYDPDLADLNAHDLRRTGAYLAYKNGYDLKQIQTMLRHKSLAVTERYIGNIIDFTAADIGYKIILG